MEEIFLKFKNIISLLENKQKRSLVYIFVIYLISIVLDVLGIGLIIPILTLIISGEINQNFLNYLPIDINNFKNENLVLIILIFFFIFYIFKSAFGTFALWYHRRFIYKLQENIGVRLLKKYILEDYETFVQRNYSDVVRNIAVEAGVFVTGVIHGLVAISTETMIVLGISLLLIFIDPISSTIIIGIVTFLVTLYLFVFKKKLRNLGKRRQELEGSIFDQLNKSFQLFKEIKIFLKHDFMIKNFKKTVEEKNKIALFEDLLNGLPKIYFELLFVFLVTGVLIFLIFNGKDINFIIPLLGLYTAAFFRIFPSFNRLISNINGVIHNYAAFELIEKDLNILKIDQNRSKNIANFPKLEGFISNVQKPFKLELENISFSYSNENTKQVILDDINLKLSSNEITGLVGESGSGKSTIANIISGFIKANKGHYKINENENYNKNLLKNFVGYLPQTTNLINDTLINNICFFKENNKHYDKEKIDYLVKILDLGDLIDKLPNGLNTNIKEQGQILSGGQRQKIALARALYVETPILIFDESTSSIDSDSELKLIEVIKKIKKDRIILFITHNRNLITHFDKTYFINDKKVNIYKS